MKYRNPRTSHDGASPQTHEIGFEAHTVRARSYWLYRSIPGHRGAVHAEIRALVLRSVTVNPSWPPPHPQRRAQKPSSSTDGLRIEVCHTGRAGGRNPAVTGCCSSSVNARTSCHPPASCGGCSASSGPAPSHADTTRGCSCSSRLPGPNRYRSNPPTFAPRGCTAGITTEGGGCGSPPCPPPPRRTSPAGRHVPATRAESNGAEVDCRFLI